MGYVNDYFGEVIRKAAVQIDGSFTNMALQVVDAGISARDQLAQLMPTDTNAQVLLACSGSQKFAIGTVLVTNVTGDDLTYRIFHDKDGTTYDTTTALFYDCTIRGNSTMHLSLLFAMNEAGNIAVRASQANSLNFTLYGATLV